MCSNRRDFLKRGLGGAIIGAMGSVSGCVELPSGDDDGGNNRGGEVTSLPNPIIERSGYPDVRSLGTSKQRVDGQYRYTADMYNTGAAGEVIVNLYVLPKDADKTVLTEEGIGAVEGSKKINQEQISIGYRENTTYEVVDDAGDGKGYWFVYQPISASVTIRNKGSSGKVRVSINGQNDEYLNKEISMQSEENVTISIDTSEEMKNISVSAQPVESDSVVITN